MKRLRRNSYWVQGPTSKVLQSLRGKAERVKQWLRSRGSKISKLGKGPDNWCKRFTKSVPWGILPRISVSRSKSEELQYRSCLISPKDLSVEEIKNSYSF